MCARNFNWWLALITVLLCAIIIAFGLWYVVDKPSFGGYYDCAWDYNRHNVTDCHTPGASWWGWAGVAPIVLACLMLALVIGMIFLRKSDSTGFDIVTYILSGAIGVVTAILAFYFIVKCCVYPTRARNRDVCDCCPKEFPHEKTCCWTWPLWFIPPAIATLVLTRTCNRCCPSANCCCYEEVSEQSSKV
jgi:hypothetical protein